VERLSLLIRPYKGQKTDFLDLPSFKSSQPAPDETEFVTAGKATRKVRTSKI
jgi:hypothetical protein